MADPDELSAHELDDRLAVQEQLPAFQKLLEANVVGFGGLYRDTTGTIVISATSNSLEEAYEIAKSAPEQARVTVVEVEWALRDLMRVRSLVHDDVADLASVGIVVHTIGIDLPMNRVEVGVQDSSGATADEFQRRYGSIVSVEETTPPQASACVGRGNCASPLKGGLNVTIGGEGCSSGFVSRAGSKYFLLSAGHCGVMNSAWYHNSVNYATTTKRAYYDGSSADVSGGEIAAGQKSNQVFKGSTTAFFSVTSNAGGGSVGDLICLSARHLGSYDCGYIADNFIEVCYESRCFWDQTSATSIDGASGQSGGSIFVLGGGSNISAAGLMTAISGGGTTIYYSKIDNVEWEIGVATCRNASCT